MITKMEIKPKFTATQKAYLLHALCLELNDVDEEYKEDVEALIHNIASMDVLDENNLESQYSNPILDDHFRGVTKMV